MDVRAFLINTTQIIPKERTGVKHEAFEVPPLSRFADDSSAVTLYTKWSFCC